MKRCLIVAALLFFLSPRALSETYYVSIKGDDSLDGTSPAAAWCSLDRVNKANLKPGDAVLFRSGDIFRGNLRPCSGASGAAVLYGRYGHGRKPIIEPSYDASDPSVWLKVSDGLWKWVYNSELEIGNIIINHGRSGCARKVDFREDLDGTDLNFIWVEGERTVYLSSVKNPGERFRSLELAERRHVIDECACHDVTYDGLWLRYGAAHGIGGDDVRNIIIRNCNVSWIGGSTNYLDNDGRSVRYGNGIEFWCGAQDILVENCRVWECWDAGLTNQSNVDNVLQRNVVYRGNKVWNCEYSYEYWQQGDGARTENVVFENNVCRNAGKGWGHTQRWNPNAAHLMFYDTTAETDGFVVRNNVFSKTEDCGFRLFNAWYPALKMEGNKWRIPRNLLCRYHGRPTSDLIYKYPDHLDQVHDDNELEIQGQIVEEPMVFGPGRKELKRFKARFNF